MRYGDTAAAETDRRDGDTAEAETGSKETPLHIAQGLEGRDGDTATVDGRYGTETLPHLANGTGRRHCHNFASWSGHRGGRILWWPPACLAVSAAAPPDKQPAELGGGPAATSSGRLLVSRWGTLSSGGRCGQLWPAAGQSVGYSVVRRPLRSDGAAGSAWDEPASREFHGTAAGVARGPLRTPQLGF